MKKVFGIIICLFMAIGVYGQDDTYLGKSKKKTTFENVNQQKAETNGWLVVECKGDELLKTKPHTSFLYENENGSVVLWSDQANKFRIIAKNDLFDFEYAAAGWNLSKRWIFECVVGFYDINGNLVSSIKHFWFEKDANSSMAFSCHGAKGKNEGNKVINYLLSEQGFVRIVAPLATTNVNFDIKIPCFNN